MRNHWLKKNDKAEEKLQLWDVEDFLYKTSNAIAEECNTKAWAIIMDIMDEEVSKACGEEICISSAEPISVVNTMEM